MMKCEFECSKDEFDYALREVIREELSKNASQLSSRVSEIIDEEIDKQIKPMIDESLKSEEFLRRCGWRMHGESRETIEKIVANTLREYLDERVYLYSKDSDLPSHRVRKSASGINEPTRLEAFLRFSIERYIDLYVTDNMAELVGDFINKKENIEELAKKQMAKLLKEKFKI